MKTFTLVLLLSCMTSILYAQTPCDSINTAAGTASVSQETACLGDSVVLEITGYTPGAGLIIQWEESPDSLSWTAISGADSAVYTIYSILGGIHHYRAYVSCGPGSDTSNVISVSVADPMILTTAGDTVCGAGNVTLQATANPGSTLNWYNVQSGGTLLGNGASFTTYINSDTTFYVQATSGGGSGVAALPSENTTFTGNVRGYWFSAPVSFNITGLRVPGATTDQSIAVIKFVPAVAPPVYSSTTNNFVTLFLTQSNSNTGVIPVNIPITAGDVIGILGQRGTTTPYGMSPYTTYIDGNPVTLSRMGMQFPLTTTAPQDIWQEPTSTNLGLIEMTYAAGCNSTRQAVDAVVTPAPAVFISASTLFLCDDDSVTLDATSVNDPNYIYTWYPGGQTGSSFTPFVTGTSMYVVEANDGTCFYSDSIQIVMSSPINSFITSSPSNFAAPNCDGTLAAYPTGGVPPYTISWNTGSTVGVCPGWYTVTITDAAGCVKIDSVYVGLINGIEELSTTGISIYPNPVQDDLIIESFQQIGEVKIYDLVGKLIINSLVERREYKINLTGLEKGIYFIEINDDHRMKFVKQ